MRPLALLLGVFALALVLSFAVGRGVRAVRGPDGAPSVVCPEGPLAERLAGHIVGLMHFHGEAYGPTLAGVVPGDRPAGPDPLTELTLVQGDALTRTGRFERILRSRVQPGSIGYHLTVPVSELPGRGTPLFVTSACVPDHPVSLRAWHTGAAFLRAGRAPELLAYLREQLPETDFMGAAPTIAGAVPTTLPDCPRVGVVASLADPAPLGAVVCLDATDSVTRTVRAPIPEQTIEAIAALDLDGDGVDELIVVHQQIVRAVTRRRAELMQHDAGSFRVHDLGAVF